MFYFFRHEISDQREILHNGLLLYAFQRALPEKNLGAKNMQNLAHFERL